MRISYLALAAAITAGGAWAATPPQGDMAMGGHGRMGGKLFAQFDLNHDGKITKAEMEKVLAQKFASASGGKSTMTEAQFAAMRVDMIKPKIETLFHRVNWSGSGKLSRDEYLAAERLRFERADRDGTGVVQCHRESEGSSDPSHRGHGAAAFCAQYDKNLDGKVTRAEFDAVTLAKYQAAAKDGGLTEDTWTSMAISHVSQMQAHAFDRLDETHSGKLTLAEFSTPMEKMFARIDANHDGAITVDEIAAMHPGHRFNWHKSGGQTSG